MSVAFVLSTTGSHQYLRRPRAECSDSGRDVVEPVYLLRTSTSSDTDASAEVLYGGRRRSVHAASGLQGDLLIEVIDVPLL